MIDPSSQGVKRRFASSFEHTAVRTGHKEFFFLPKVEIKDYIVMMDDRNFLDQPVKYERTYDNIRKIATVQGDYYTTGCLLDYSYFRENFKMILIDLSKQLTRKVDLKAMQQINFTGNLEKAWNTTVFFFIEEVKETIVDFSKGTLKIL